jgi:hypothetical protein
VRKDPTWRKYQLLADWVWREKILEFNGHDGTEE